MQAITDPDQTDSTWEQLSPFLDEAMAQLRDKDRDAIVLRYFENRSLKEIGGALGVEERAAQKRVARGLEKLRKFFVKRGIASTTVTLAGAISANSVQAAPIELAKTISAVAIAKGAAASVFNFGFNKRRVETDGLGEIQNSRQYGSHHGNNGWRTCDCDIA